MQDADLLLTIAEVAVTFAGFASLMSILGSQTSRDPPVVQAARIRMMIVNGLVVAAFAFVPFVPHRLGLSDPVVWRVSSALLAVAGAGIALVARGNLRRVGAVGPVPRSFVWRGMVIGGGLLVAEIILVVNLLGGFPRSAETVYIVGLLLYLFLAGFMFLNMVMSFLITSENER